MVKKNSWHHPGRAAPRKGSAFSLSGTVQPMSLAKPCTAPGTDTLSNSSVTAPDRNPAGDRSPDALDNPLCAAEEGGSPFLLRGLRKLGQSPAVLGSALNMILDLPGHSRRTRTRPISTPPRRRLSSHRCRQHLWQDCFQPRQTAAYSTTKSQCRVALRRTLSATPLAAGTEPNWRTTTAPTAKPHAIRPAIGKRTQSCCQYTSAAQRAIGRLSTARLVPCASGCFAGRTAT